MLIIKVLCVLQKLNLIIRILGKYKNICSLVLMDINQLYLKTLIATI